MPRAGRSLIIRVTPALSWRPRLGPTLMAHVSTELMFLFVESFGESPEDTLHPGASGARHALSRILCDHGSG